MIHFCFGSWWLRKLLIMDSYFNGAVMHSEEFRRWMPLLTNYNGINEWKSFVPYKSSILHDELILQKNYNYSTSCNQSVPPYLRNLGNYESLESNHFIVSDNTFHPGRDLWPPQNNSPVKPKISNPEDSTSWSRTSSDGDSISQYKNYELPMPQHKISPGAANTYTKPSSTISSQIQTICNFCRQNGDTRGFYTGHRLKDNLGNVECPVLRKHVCEVCGATGHKAHTISYCPVLKASGKQPSKNAASLKHTKHDSSGRVRRQKS